MKMTDLLKFEHTLNKLSYSHDILDFNRKHAFMHDLDDVPFLNLETIRIKGSQVSTQIQGSTCTWREIFQLTDKLIPELENPNEIFLEDVALVENTLLVTLGS